MSLPTFPRRSGARAFALTALLCACSVEAGGPNAPSEEEPLNLLLVTIDTLRRDHLGCYGYFRNTSPNLDALAEESLVFEDLQTHVAQTLPSHTTLFTGLSPREHGIESNLNWLHGSWVLSPNIRTLASELSDQGYQTAGFISAAPLRKGTGAETGFQTWVEPDGAPLPANVTIDSALAWLDTSPSEPWFLWVHVFDPHDPYSAPEEFERFGPSDEQRDHLAALGIQEIVVGKKGKRISVAKAHDMYDAEILFTDHEMGRLLDRVRSNGSGAENPATGAEAVEGTAIVVTSDHGEGLWQHGFHGHSRIWGEHLGIPLIVQVPGVQPARIEHRMAGQDILPTMLTLLPGVDWTVLQDQSSGANVLATDFEARPRYTMVPPSPVRQELNRYMPEHLHAIEHDGWRLLITLEGAPKLYDLETDPNELENRAGSEPERVSKMRSLLEERYEKERARCDELEAGDSIPIPEERMEALRALGYGGGS